MAVGPCDKWVSVYLTTTKVSEGMCGGVSFSFLV